MLESMPGYRAITIDPDIESRNRLQLTVRGSGKFERFTSLDPSAMKTLDLENYDIAFLSSKLGPELVRQLAVDCKRVQVTVLLLVPSRVEGAYVTSSVLEGIDGILVQPYSVESMLECISLAERTKQLKHSTRVRKAMGVLVSEIRSLQTSLASAQKSSRGGKITEVVLAEIRTLVRSFDDVLIAQYYFALFDEYLKERVPEDQKRYRGTSERIQIASSKRALIKIQRVLNG